MDVYVQGKKIRLKPTQSIGKGGEADVYEIAQNLALKIFKSPDHPDYQGSLEQQKAAQERLDEHQFKLKLFPNNLPPQVIAPQDLAIQGKNQQIIGYTMALIKGAEVLMKYSDRAFCQKGISPQTVVNIFQDLYKTVMGIHQQGVIIGDFNDLNVLVKGNSAYIIDADSFQFVTFPCRVFTSRFVDPLLCDPDASKAILRESYNPFSDWYAFNVMLMQSLLFVHPFGGIYRPKDASKRIPHEARPLQGISIFHSEVQYPKPAIPYQVLPDDLLHHFYEVFVQDVRSIFPQNLLEKLDWKKCPQCGIQHTRLVCPICIKPLMTPVMKSRGNIIVTPIFRTEGVILFATLQNNQLRWIYHDQGKFYREDQSIFLTGELDPEIQFKIQGKSTTLLGKQGQLITLTPGKSPDSLAVESFDTNEFSRYWSYGGQLLKDGVLGAEYIGDILPNQTRFWVGETFGFGFYRAGNLKVSFVFDTHKPGIYDRISLPYDSGQLVDTSCVFSRERCWFFWSIQERGNLLKKCAIILPNGQVEATLIAQAGDDSWLGTFGGNLLPYGKCAAGNFLLLATDDGIIRVESISGQIVKTKEFPDTEPWVDSQSQLFASSEGLLVIKNQEIIRLALN